jgi:integrase
MQRLSLGLRADAAGLQQALERLMALRWELDQGCFDWAAWRRRAAPGHARDAAAPRTVEGDVGDVPQAPMPLAPTPAAGVGSGELFCGASASGAPPTAALAEPGDGAAPQGSVAPGRRVRRRASDGTAAPLPFGAPSRGPGTPLTEPLAAFERAFFADPRRRSRRAGSRTTWTAAYLPYLRRLEARSGGAPLEPALLEAVLESYPLSSRSRQQCAIALAALARHHGLVLPDDWNARGGGYGLHAARFRQLPSDAEILALVERIPNPRWRLAYGLMATYGLRNHEVFFCDTSPLAPGGDRVIRVLPTSKTGEHQVWPFQPGWVERFALERLGTQPAALPQIRTDLPGTTLQQVGRRVAEQFRRYGLPLTPYDLRHAWAVRTIHIGLPDTVAARMMGHSVAIHTRTYHHWITRRDQQQAVDAALQRQRAA